MPEFYHPEGPTRKHGDKLPHWQQGEVMQFVTFRLADSMPSTKIHQWREELAAWKKHNPEPWTPKQQAEYHNHFTWKIEHWLDEGHGSCLLSDPTHRTHLEHTIMHDHGTKAEHHAWVIMPNHIHLLFTPHASLAKLMQTWKGISARKIGLGSIWQKKLPRHPHS
jgi:putative transposase